MNGTGSEDTFGKLHPRGAVDAEPGRLPAGGAALTIGGMETMSGEEPGEPVLAGRYKVVKRLGEGGMGSVWLAEDLKLDNRKVAVKMLPALLAGRKGAYRQVKQEALMAMKLSHPNIATVRAFEEEGGNPFLVMDYIEGTGFDDVLEAKGKLTEEETLEILGPVASALDYAHGQGVVHRDVKPANVVIRKDGTPFVLDFGIAREIQETLTRVTGKFSSGTLMYMSPEQLHGRAPKASQDVYSFAVMAYECLAGEPPFSRGQIEYQIDHDEPAALPAGAAGEALRQGVMSGLSKDPEKRPASCADVLGGGSGKGAGGQATRFAGLGTGGAYGNAPAVRRRVPGRAWGAGIALAAVLAGLCAWWWTKPAPTAPLPPPPSEPASFQPPAEPSGHIHSMGDWQTRNPATCERDGSKARTCSGCGWEETVRIPATGHRWSVWKAVEAPVAGAPGGRERVCANCGEKQVEIVAEGGCEGAVWTVALPEGRTMRLRWCPAGSFTMGSPLSEANRFADEIPHRVVLTRGFWMGETEVTQEQWAALMDGETIADLARKGLQDETAYDLADRKGALTMRERWGLDADSDPMIRCGDLDGGVPVYNVSWDDAQTFCRRLTEKGRAEGWLPGKCRFRLPTEAEWEHACRAGTAGALPGTGGGNGEPALDDIAWYEGNSDDGFREEGLKRGADTADWPGQPRFGELAWVRKAKGKAPNRWGLHDMIGNVWEWCEDERAAYPSGPVTNYVKRGFQADPTDLRTVRGGSWDFDARHCRSACRLWGAAGFRGNNIGFRPVCAVELAE